MVLVNGKILSVDDRFSQPEAMAIRGGRVSNVGTTREIRKFDGPLTRVIDLAAPLSWGSSIPTIRAG
jgi:predicted amidohydrolase YtcJ